MTEAATLRGAIDAGMPRPLAVDAVLFDLDGTLVDTAPDLVRAVNRLRTDRGLAPLPFAQLRPYASHGARGLLGAGMAVTPGDADYVPLRDAFLDHYAAALCIESSLFDEMERLLAALDDRALPWGIVTNKATRFTTPLLDALGLSARAGTVVCGDTTPHAKPHPAPLLHAAAALGVPPARCLYVGDAQRDIEAGIAAGMRTIVARYGYIQPEDRPDSWPADGHIAGPAALIAWLPERVERAPGHDRVGTRS
jgi:N-acetyl-D-muramate 6-phosphate phosphatase